MVEEFGSSQIFSPPPPSPFAVEYLQTKKRRKDSGEAASDSDLATDDV